jgi:hypothetical protein
MLVTPSGITASPTQFVFPVTALLLFPTSKLPLSLQGTLVAAAKAGVATIKTETSKGGNNAALTKLSFSLSVFLIILLPSLTVCHDAEASRLYF